MDFRKLLQDERRRERERERAAQKLPLSPERTQSSAQDGRASADAGAAAGPLSDARDEPMSCWRPRSLLDLEPFRIPGVQRVYCVPEWLSQEEEDEILSRVNAAPPAAWVQLRLRRLQMYGGDVSAAFRPELLPRWLEQIVDALVASGVFVEVTRPNHALINEYGVGDCILPHEDGPSYFPLVAIASTGADAFVTFAPHRQHAGDATLRESRFAVRRRSLLIFTDDAYTKCLHSIDGVASGRRVSLTIRHVHVTDEPPQP